MDKILIRCNYTTCVIFDFKNAEFRYVLTLLLNSWSVLVCRMFSGLQCWHVAIVSAAISCDTGAPCISGRSTTWAVSTGRSRCDTTGTLTWTTASYGCPTRTTSTATSTSVHRRVSSSLHWRCGQSDASIHLNQYGHLKFKVSNYGSMLQIDIALLTITCYS